MQLDGELHGLTEESITSSMSVSELQKIVKASPMHAAAYTRPGATAHISNALEKSELVAAARAAVRLAQCTKYDLIANISLTAETTEAAQSAERAKEGAEAVNHRCSVLHEATAQWYEIQDLHVAETMPQLIAQSETLLMVYRNQEYARQFVRTGREDYFSAAAKA